MEKLNYWLPSAGPPPTTSVPPPQPRPTQPHGHGKQAAAGGGVAAAKRPTGPKKTQGNGALKMVMIGILVLGLVAITVAIIMVIPAAEDPACIRLKTEGQVITPFDVNQCDESKKKCTFDTTSCNAVCPFGYMMEDGCQINCVCATRGRFEGDVQFDEYEVPKLLEQYVGFPDNRSFEVFAGNSITFDRDKWELGANGRIQVPYIFNPGLNSKAHFAVNSAADFLARWTCIDLNKRKKERRYIRFIRGDGCSSRIGRGFGVQDIHLAFGCEHRGIVLHEVFHAIGFYHEQARPDRDRYIEVFLNNVYPRHRHNYHKMNPANVANLGFGYDLRSFLHYESHAFQKDQISPTFIVRSTGLPMYLAANNPSDIDIAEVDTLYRCPIKAADRRGTWGPWKAWSACYDGCSSIKITKIRYRFCKNARGGHATSCPGSNTNSGICKRKIYACKPKYSQWTAWSNCRQSCNAGGAIKTKRRNCISQPRQLCPEAWLFHPLLYDWTYCNQNVHCPVSELMKRIRKKRKELFDIAKWSAWAHWYPGCPDPCNGVATQRSERLCMRHSVVRNICQGEYTKMSNGDIGYQLRQRFCTCQYGITPPNGIRLSKTTIILKRQKRVIGNFTSWADLHNEEAAFLCLNGKKIIGKFDGDDFKDMICLRHNSIQLFSGTELGIQHGYSLDKDLEFCNTNQHTLLHDAADINGDGIDDVACIDRNSGQIQILTLVENRIVIRADWAGLQDFCVGDDLILAAQLVYSDVRPDLVCVDSVKRSETFAVNNWNL